MTTRDFTANVISATKVVPDGNFKNSAASGVWDINEALDLIKGGNWPNAANIDPAAFVDGLFSTDLWTSDGSSAQTITNNIDLSNKGGLVWIKDRSTAKANVLVDTARISGNTDNYLMSDSTNAQTAHSNEFGDFTSTGYTLPRNTEAGYTNTNTGRDYVGWTFRKAPKFFDIVQFTNSTGGDEDVSHNLGAVPAMIIGKRTDTTDNWMVWHIGTSMSNGGFTGLGLDNTGSAAFTGVQSDQGINSNTFNTGYVLSNDGSGGYSKANQLNGEYVFYLFAHNNNDGGFGPDADQDVIKCGSYTGVSSTEISVDLGFEPQFIMIKRATGSSLGVYASWFVQDTMRGMVAKGADAKGNVLYWNKTQAEGFRGNGDSTSTEIQVHPNATGFTVPSTNSVEVNQASETYIYMAIRRGGMSTPTVASEVFAIDEENASAPYYTSNFPVDTSFIRVKNSSSSYYFYDRLRQDKELVFNTTAAEGGATNAKFDYQDGFYAGATGNGLAWMFKRARGFFDVVAYTGTGSNRTISHNLGVEPEIIIVKQRSSANEWFWYVKSLGNTKKLELPGTGGSADAAVGGNQLWNSTTPTSSVFSVSDNVRVNESGETYMAYLFATVAGVSKVGTITATGSDVDVDCGFTNGSKFVLLKRTSSSDDWFIFRDIASGDDKRLKLNNTAAEVSSDNIDPLSSGFTMTSGILGSSGNEFIFYAVANDPS